MGKRSQRKGKSGELEIQKLMQALVDAACVQAKVGKPGTRRVQRNLLQAAEGGADLVGVPGMAVEVKRAETLRLATWWAQAVRQAIGMGAAIPVLCYRQNRHPWSVRVFAKIPVDKQEALDFPVDLSLEQFKIFALTFLVRRLQQESLMTPDFSINLDPVDIQDHILEEGDSHD